MKVTVYLLKNDSYSIGRYVINGEEFSLPPRSKIRVTTEPSSITANIIKRSIVSEVPNVKKSKATEIKGE